MRRFIEKQSARTYDVLIVGGGITGAAMAYEAASQGLITALVEMRDFSWATSAATSKLIHGGLRYLANGEISLVRESLNERRILENIAPNFVYPMPIMMPHSNDRLTNNKYLVKAALLLYDLLAFDKGFTWDTSQRIPRHRSISREEALKREPGLKPAVLTGASIFYDCVSIFPERLTLAFLASACSIGADVANYAKVREFLRDSYGRITGARVEDLLDGTMHEIRARITVNCGGPWADILLGMASSANTGASIRRSEGIHIITPKKMLSGRHIIASMTTSGRHFFLIPWRKHTLIGTTDKSYVGAPDSYRVTKTSILELIAEVNNAYGDGTLAYPDIVHAYGGLRPLVEKQTEETYALSRRYEITDNAADGIEGFITVEGGKYTTSRNLARKCINLVQSKIGNPVEKSVTSELYLKGCEINDVQTFLSQAWLEYPDFPPESVNFLARIYGTLLSDLAALASADASLREPLNADGEILAQVVYAIRNEMARTLADIVLRRTGIATLGYPGDECMQKVARIAAAELKWDGRRTDAELQSVRDQLLLPRD